MQLGEQLRQPLWFFSLPEKSIEVNNDLDIKIRIKIHKCMMNNGKCLPSTMSRGCWVKLSIPSYLFSIYRALDESLHESI